jgi:predicted methyltransferase
MLLCAASASAALAADATDPLVQAIASPARSAKFTARDVYRHPLATLRFFGLRPEQTVVEIWPGGGWYTEILAPFLRDRGKYYAAVPSPKSAEGKLAEFRQKLEADPGRYGKATLTELQSPKSMAICPPGSADLVLTFRNVHNWVAGGYEQDAFNAFFKALKPGGVLGVVEHRAKPGTTLEQTKKSGYVEESYVKTLATKAGFEFAGASPVNDNAKDTKDYPEGVWTLPPTLTLGDKDKARYLAIGESDRMTLKFIKPAR